MQTHNYTFTSMINQKEFIKGAFVPSTGPILELQKCIRHYLGAYNLVRKTLKSSFLGCKCSLHVSLKKKKSSTNVESAREGKACHVEETAGTKSLGRISHEGRIVKLHSHTLAILSTIKMYIKK